MLLGRRTAFASLLACALLAGCKDDSPDPYMYPDAGMNHCANASDRALVDYGWLDAGAPDPRANHVGQIVEDCALMDCFLVILNGGDLPACMDPCVDASPAATLSEACRACYYDVVYCAAVVCVTECGGNDNSLCDACVIEKCDPALYICSGLSNP